MVLAWSKGGALAKAGWATDRLLPLVKRYWEAPCGPGEALSFDRTRSACLGVLSLPPSGGLFMDVLPLNVNKVKTYICGCV